MSHSAGGAGGSGRSYLRSLLSCAVWSVVIAVVTATLGLGLTTVMSAYPGETTPTWTSPRAVRADVDRCERTGPVSSSGFGYWWRCQVVVREGAGPTRNVVLSGSVVTGADTGRSVALVQRCASRVSRECAYTRSGSEVVAVAIRLLHVLRITVVVLGMIIIVLLLVRGVLGQRLYARLVSSGQEPASERGE
ncbi:DUF6346 domain-containing protein [Micromonospora yasonensis]|uniref:DUF6346 domain-containing protein n=1 Tax=Micromonospora yasonensis TaxID=1128667 RepID=UPI00222FA0E6|nr:DUF6346 domain-containing protein [Micromonospora yasonensis]MCW3845180.1 DUF6346 domain-containing protein [Micromonospora yasonensis]